LSVPKSKGPANISGFLLKANDPGDDWVCINSFSDGVLIKTEKPTVQLSIVGRSSFAVFIPRGTLLDRYSLIETLADVVARDLLDDVIVEPVPEEQSLAWVGWDRHGRDLKPHE
jgi:hypothetical protein